MCERYLIVEGSGWVEVGDALAGVVQRGSVVFIPPDVPQRIHSIGDVDLVFPANCTPRFRLELYDDTERTP
jgi:mannose-6-phosphate isomerase-like protein (cupin superfamily)